MVRSLCAAGLLMVLAATAHAQSKTGTTIGQFTLIEPSARSAAMGGAGVTASSEVLSAFYNPGALAALQKSDIQFSHEIWFADISLVHAGAAFSLEGFGTLAAMVTNLNSGDIDVTTVQQPLGTGEQYSVNDLLVGIGYGLRLNEQFTVGVQVNYVTERILHSSLSVFGVNIGTLYELSPGGLRIGASLSNFGSRGRYEGTDLYIRYDMDPERYGDNSSIPGAIETDDFSLPILFRIGLGYPLAIDGSNVVEFAVEAQHPSDNSECLNLGAEWRFREVLALRLGYNSLFQVDSEYGLTAGAGLMWDGLGYLLRFDYAWTSHQRLGSLHHLTLGFGF
jgi:hypothetical protein